jgi:hypothetical protein
MDNVTVLDGKAVTDLRSVIPLRFVGLSRLGITISSFAHRLLRAACCTRFFSVKLHQVTIFPTGVNVCSKTKLIKKTLRRYRYTQTFPKLHRDRYTQDCD